MFTGLIEHIGTVSKIVSLDQTESGGGGWSITISDAAPVLGDCHIGDSICCNGACLTVTELTSNSFKVGVAPETLNRTNLGDLKVGSQVNLERAMAAHARFGGHMVQGHVDGTVTIISREPDANSLRLQFRVPEATPTRSSILPYIIEKGFVTLDGASLTITTINDSERIFGVMLIAHTQTKIDLANKAVGDRVNVEVDMVGKYVEKAVISTLRGQRSSGLQTQMKAVDGVAAQRPNFLQNPAHQLSTVAEGDKEIKLSPYMAFLKQGIVKYKEQNPGAPHKEAFSKVAAMWGESDDNPNKSKAKAANVDEDDIGDDGD